MFSKFFAALLTVLLLAGCARPAEVHPALWQVEGPKGEKAWLFGTIHALPDPVQWKSAKVGAAMKDSDVLVLEVAAILSTSRTTEIFANLAQSPGLPRLADRVPPDLRNELEHELGASGYLNGELDHYETWAAMLMFQQAIGARSDADSENGIDRAIVRDWPGRVDEFEGAAAQFRIFDGLPEVQQRALLAATLRDAPQQPAKLALLQKAWANGDVDMLARATDQDFAGQPALKAVLLTDRNRAWLDKLVSMMAGSARPFVAVGAAHLVGPDGLPALLAAKGYKVTRLQ